MSNWHTARARSDERLAPSSSTQWELTKAPRQRCAMRRCECSWATNFLLRPYGAREGVSMRPLQRGSEAFCGLLDRQVEERRRAGERAALEQLRGAVRREQVEHTNGELLKTLSVC